MVAAASLGPRGLVKEREMKHRLPVAAAAVLAVTATVALVGGRAWSAPEAARPLRIGVVSLTRLWDGYQRRLFLDSKLIQFRQTKAQTLQEKKDEVDQLRQKIELLAPGSTQRQEAEGELQQKQVEGRTLAELSAKEVARRYFEYWDLVYNDIRAAVQQVAQAQGYDLVFKTVESQSRTTSTRELQGKIEGRTVLYAAAELDLTEEVLTVLNENFARSGEAKEQAP